MDSISSSPCSLKKKGGRQRDAVWNNFSEERNIAGEAIVHCKKCTAVYKSSTSAPNLKRHWRMAHPDEEQPSQKIGSKFTKKKINTRIHQTQSALSDVLSIPALSINLMLHPLMKKLFHVINSNIQMPNSFACMKELLVNRVELVKEDIKCRLGKLPYRASITCDIWTDSGMRHSYLGVTIHYCDTDGTLRRNFLGLSELETAHTAHLIRNATEEILSEYGIDMQQVFKVVTDNGSNIVCAFKDILPVDLDIEFLLDVNEPEENHPEEPMDDETFSGIELPEHCLEICSAFPMRLSCFGHNMQLVILEFFKQYVTQSAAFKILCSLIGRFKRSSHASNALERATGKTLVDACKTRWGSYVTVLERFLEISGSVTVIAREKKWPHPSVEQTAFLDTVHNLTKIFLDVICKIQSEKDVSISRCYIYLKVLFRALARFQDPQNENMRDALKQILQKRFDKFLNARCSAYDPIFIVASALDPNTANMLGESEMNLAASSILGMVPIEEIPLDNVAISSEALVQSELDTIMTEMAEELVSLNRLSMQNGGKERVLEVLKYVRSLRSISNGPIDSIKFWLRNIDKDGKDIAKLALEILAITGTNTPVERVFSQCGLATARHRNRTNFQLLDSQLLVYLNSYCYEK